MLYAIKYGCVQETHYLVVEADNIEYAAEFAEESAIECWSSWTENMEQNEYEKYTDSWWDTVYSEIEQFVEPFENTNSFHLDLLKEQGNGFFKI